MTMNLFHNMTITLQYQVVKKLTENLDERMRYQILLNLHYSNLLKGEVVRIYIFENFWAPFSQFKSIWECTAKDVLKINHAPRIDSDTRAQV